MILCLHEGIMLSLFCLIDFRCFVVEGSMARFVLIMDWWW